MITNLMVPYSYIEFRVGFPGVFRVQGSGFQACTPGVVPLGFSHPCKGP